MNIRQPGLRFLLTGFAIVVLMVWWRSPRPLPSEPPRELMATGFPAHAMYGPSPIPGAGGSESRSGGSGVGGNWVGSLQLGASLSQFRFSLVEHNGQLGGTVDFPVGGGTVQSGTVDQGVITLVTRNRDMSTGQALLTRFNGRRSGDQLDLVMSTEAGDMKLTLHRVQ